MVATVFILGLLYVAVMAILIGLVGLPWPIVLVVSAIGLFAQWYFSDRLALSSMGGREVTEQEAPQLHAIVDRLCALADMPKPRVAIADMDLPNAFATGRSPKRAVICATTGILRRLDERELEGVLSHELSHVAHRDVTVMTVASFVSVLAGLLVRSLAYGGMARGRRSSRDEGNAAMLAALVVVSSIAVYALSFLAIRALSRYRELAADRAGAMLTGNPAELASALVKVSGDMARIPTQDLRKAEAFNAFFFAPAVAPGMSLSSIFSTHPPLQQRLERLGRLSTELGRPG